MSKFLIHADFGASTGFATVAHNFVKQLLQGDNEFDVVAINYFGGPTEWQQFYPQVKLFPAKQGRDPFGRDVLIQKLRSYPYDYLWQVQDSFVVEPVSRDILHAKHSTKWICYYPIDAPPKRSWIQAVGRADSPVTYTPYGFTESVKQLPMLEKILKIIPHGTDVDTFYPLSAEEKMKFRSQFFEEHSKKKILLNVNRNQPRKDLPRCLQLIKEIRKHDPSYILYLHCRVDDVGGNIHEYASSMGCRIGEDYIILPQLIENNFPPEELNRLYNACDALVTTTLGGGWELSVTEAMAAKLPVVAPDHTSLHDILADGRGALVPTDDFTFIANDNSRPRLRTDVKRMAEVILNNEFGDVEKAYDHVVRNWTWESIGRQWQQLL